MRLVVNYWIVLMIFLCGCSSEPLSVQTGDELPLKVEISCPTGPQEIGQSIRLQVRYTNTSMAPLSIVNVFEPLSPILWEARDQKMRPVEIRKEMKAYNPAEETRISQLKPGESIEGVADINQYLNFVDTEDYSVVAHYTALPQGTPVSNSCRFQLKWPGE